MKALEIFSLLSLPKSLEIGITIASKANLPVLIERMGLLQQVNFFYPYQK